MVLEPVRCIHCDSSDVVKHGCSETGEQRYRCCNDECSHVTFMLSYTNIGCLPEKDEVFLQLQDLLEPFGIKRLARKTICFSKLEEMHDIVIGLFINHYEFCNPV